MKLRYLIWGLGVGCVCLAGCSTNRGTATDEYYSGSSGVKGSPTMRPGMDPEDIRDPNPNYLNRQPSTTTTP